MARLLDPFDGRDDAVEDPDGDIEFFEMLQRKDLRAGRGRDPELEGLIEDARSRKAALVALGREEAPG